MGEEEERSSHLQMITNIPACRRRRRLLHKYKYFLLKSFNIFHLLVIVFTCFMIIRYEHESYAHLYIEDITLLFLGQMDAKVFYDMKYNKRCSTCTKIRYVKNNIWHAI